MTTFVIYFLAAFCLISGNFIVFRGLVRREYQRKGRLTPVSGFLETLVFILFMAFPYIYNPPEWPWTWSPDICPPLRITGLAVLIIGAAIAFPAMVWLGMCRSFGQEVNVLRTTSFYRFTRNPQIVGGALLVIGDAMLWPSGYALGWIVLYAIFAHTMVLTEEEHMGKIYGERYMLYCKKIPRYLGIPRG